MNNVTVTVGSVTYALKLKRLLKRAGIDSTLLKLDNTDQNSGCTHGVSFSEADFYRAVVIMRENNIAYTLRRG